MPKFVIHYVEERNPRLKFDLKICPRGVIGTWMKYLFSFFPRSNKNILLGGFLTLIAAESRTNYLLWVTNEQGQLPQSDRASAFGSLQGPWSTIINNFLTSSLITMQNLVAVSHVCVCVHACRKSQKFGDGRAHAAIPNMVGMADPLEACSPTCYGTEFGRSTSKPMRAT